MSPPELDGITSGYYDEPLEVANVADSRVSLDHAEFRANRMTAAERAHFDEHGFVIIKDALPAAEHESLLHQMHGLREQKIREGRHPTEQLRQPIFSPTHSAGASPTVHNLLTTPKVFPKVVDILGCNIFLYHGYVVGDLPASPGTQIPTDFDSVPTFGYHQDSGMQNDLRNALDDHSHPVSPRMSLKCAYYLTDCSKPGCGNTWIIPGSMKTDLVGGANPFFPQNHTGPNGQPPGAIPVIVPANSCMIFDRRLWHAATPNWSAHQRIVIFMGYGYRWLKPRDAMYVEDTMTMLRCPIQRQLLGATTQMSGLYHGNGLDIPLRQWLHTKGGGDQALEGIGWQVPTLGSCDKRGIGHAPMSRLPGEIAHATFPRHPERLQLPLLPHDAEIKDSTGRSRSIHGTMEETYERIRLADVELDPDAYVQNRLTAAEAAAFERDGFIIVENALPEQVFQSIKALLAEEFDHQVEAGLVDPTGLDAHAAGAHCTGYSQLNDLQTHKSFQQLLTNTRTFPKIVDILGTNISMYHCPCIVSPGKGLAEEDYPDPTTLRPFGYHQDSGLQADCEYRPAPRFSLKAGYYLSDMSTPGRGNTWVVPGSHKVDTDADIQIPTVGQPAGAVPVICPPNSCLIFDRRLLHAASPNYSEDFRFFALVGYAYRWLKPKEPLNVEAAYSVAKCPLQQQMMGHTTSNMGLCGPSSEDTPLLPWLYAHGIQPKYARWGKPSPLAPPDRRRGGGGGALEGDCGHATSSRAGDKFVDLSKAMSKL